MGRFLNPRLDAILADGQIRTLRTGSPVIPALTVIPRAQCTFARIRLAADTSEGLRAARFKLEQSKPFVRTRSRLVRDGKPSLYAGAWTWDASRLTAENKAVDTYQAIPETLARIPLTSGVRLATCLEGVEGEVWENGVLTASRWWPAPPELKDWQLFLRAAKIRLDDHALAVPEPMPLAWRSDLPAIDRDADNLRQVFSVPRLAAAAAGVLLFFGAFQASRIAIHENRIDAATARLSALISDNQDANAQRARALSARQAIAGPAALDHPAQVLHALETVLSVLDPDKVEMNSFRINDDRLEARFTVDTAPNMSDLVRDLENTAIFDGVFVERPNARFLVIQATVTPVNIRSRIVPVGIDEDEAQGGTTDGEQDTENSATENVGTGSEANAAEAEPKGADTTQVGPGRTGMGETGVTRTRVGKIGQVDTPENSNRIGSPGPRGVDRSE